MPYCENWRSNGRPRILLSLFSVHVLCVALVVGQVFFMTGCAGPSKYETIQIKEISERYELTVPVSQLIMTIPKGGLQQKKMSIGGSTDNPRYFLFENKSIGLLVSGWFEPEQKFSGIKEYWDDNIKSWRRSGQPEPQDVSFIKVGRLDVIMYNLPIPLGVPAKTNSHMRANWVQAGTWIDLHISITSNRSSAESRSKLFEFLQTIQVKEKIGRFGVK